MFVRPALVMSILSLQIVSFTIIDEDIIRVDYNNGIYEFLNVTDCINAMFPGEDDDDEQ